MAEKKFKDALETLLKKDKRLVDESQELNLARVRDLADKSDGKLIELLLSNDEAKNKFFLKVKDVLVFKQTDFKFFLDANQIDNSYTAYENKIGLANGSRLLKENGDVVLNFPYKDCILEGGQSTEEGTDEYYSYNEEEEKYEIKTAQRKEIFFNEVIAKDEIDRLEEPKAFTNIIKYTAKGKEKIKSFERNKDGLITDNLIIKGNNLLALHCLRDQFSEQVKVIYIDPPYNTGTDTFKYNDRFNHSTWLTFMKNRLEIGKDLLAPDGFIFIQINDVEVAHLKILADEIFGRENFQTSICVKMSHLSGHKMAHKEKKLPKIKEHILMYAKNDSAVKINPVYTSVSWDSAFERYNSFIEKGKYGDKDCDKWQIITLAEAIKKNVIDSENEKNVLKFKLENANLIFRTSVNRSADYSAYPSNKFSRIQKSENEFYFIYKGEEVSWCSEKIQVIDGKKTPVSILGDIWTDIGINNLSNEGGVSLRFGKKPEKLIGRIIEMTTAENDLVLDFFVGSGTAVTAAHKMKRRYIGIEQLNYTETLPLDRLKNVIKGEESGISKVVKWKGGGSFVYIELKKWNEEAKEKIKECGSLKELEKLLKELSEKYFLNYNVRLKEFQEKIIHEDAFKKLPLKKQQEMFAKMLDLNQLYVNASEMEDKKYGLTKEEIALTKNFYNQ